MVAFASAIAAAPTRVLPAPHGSTTTPEPPAQNDSTASCWYDRRCQPFSASSIGCASPSTYPARSSAGQPSLSSACLSRPRSDGCTAMVSASMLRAQHAGELLAFATSTSTARSSAAQHEAVGGMVGQLEPAVPVHRLGDVDQQGVRHRVPRVAQQRVDHALRVVPGRAGVPQAEWGQPVRVHVLRRAFQLRERRDRHPAGGARPDGRPPGAASCRTGRSTGRWSKGASVTSRDVPVWHGDQRWDDEPRFADNGWRKVASAVQPGRGVSTSLGRSGHRRANGK